MRTRPAPAGFQHAIELRLRRAPADRHTDLMRALADLETGLAQPVVEVVEEYEYGSVVVQVSLFSDNTEPSRQEVSAPEGLVAELRYLDHDRG